MSITLRRKVRFLKSYEDDSSKEAWKFYKNQYTSSDWNFWKEFDFDNIKTRYQKYRKYDKSRYLLWIKDNSKLTKELGLLFSFGGERVFNFKTQYYNLKKIVESSCSNNKELDRLDTFLAIVDDYFNKKNDLILSYTKGEPNEQFLINFLKIENFADIYDFIDKIYRVNDIKFINELICNGRKSMENINDVERYCLLAKEYWKLK